MNRLSNFLQFIIGFFLGVFLLIGGTAALGFIFFSRLAAPPPKPIFAEEKNTASPASQPQASGKTEEKQVAKPTPKPTPEASPEEKPKEDDLPAGAYQARVNWSEGLSLRSEPSKEAERIGGVEYNTEIVVLEKSRDGNWEKIRLPGSNQEGWIKSGNIEKLRD